MRRRRAPEIIAGRIAADGSIQAGDGFTVVKSATGTYVLTFPNFRLISCNGNVSGGGVTVIASSYGANTVTLTSLNTSGVGTDPSSSLSFTAFGNQQ